MNVIVAQSAIAEILQHRNELAAYAHTIPSWGMTKWEHNAREQAEIRAACSAYETAAHIIARQFGINLKFEREEMQP